MEYGSSQRQRDTPDNIPVVPVGNIKPGSFGTELPHNRPQAKKGANNPTPQNARKKGFSGGSFASGMGLATIVLAALLYFDKRIDNRRIQAYENKIAAYEYDIGVRDSVLHAPRFSRQEAMERASNGSNGVLYNKGVSLHKINDAAGSVLGLYDRHGVSFSATPEEKGIVLSIVYVTDPRNDRVSLLEREELIRSSEAFTTFYAKAPKKTRTQIDNYLKKEPPGKSWYCSQEGCVPALKGGESR